LTLALPPGWRRLAPDVYAPDGDSCVQLGKLVVTPLALTPVVDDVIGALLPPRAQAIVTRVQDVPPAGGLALHVVDVSIRRGAQPLEWIVLAMVGWGKRMALVLARSAHPWREAQRASLLALVRAARLERAPGLYVLHELLAGCVVAPRAISPTAYWCD
jgi:hypothetical protein